MTVLNTEPLENAPPVEEISRDSGKFWERWSRRSIWWSAIVLVFVVANSCWQAYRSDEAARGLRCDEPVFDFGVAYDQDAIEHTFRVTNIGRHALTVEHVYTSCGCTTIGDRLEGQIVAPGASLAVPVRLTMSAAKIGPLQQSIFIQFSGEQPLRLKLSLKGTVEQLWTWSPASLTFAGLRADEERTQAVTLRQHRDAPSTNIERVVLSGKLIRAELRPLETAAEPGACEIIVMTQPPLPVGRFDTSIYATAVDDSRLIGPIRVTLIVDEGP